jgi:hypothetical protein
LGSDDGEACVSGVAGVGGAGVNVAAGTDGDWSRATMVAPVGIGAWNWLSAGVSVCETRTVGLGETGAEGVENCSGAVEGCAGTLGNECVASEAT